MYEIKQIMEWNAPIHCQMQHWPLLYAPNYTEMPSTKLPADGMKTVALLLFIEFLGVFILDMGARSFWHSSCP